MPGRKNFFLFGEGKTLADLRRELQELPFKVDHYQEATFPDEQGQPWNFIWIGEPLKAEELPARFFAMLWTKVFPCS